MKDNTIDLFDIIVCNEIKRNKLSPLRLCLDGVEEIVHFWSLNHRPDMLSLGNMNIGGLFLRFHFLGFFLNLFVVRMGS